MVRVVRWIPEKLGGMKRWLQAGMRWRRTLRARMLFYFVLLTVFPPLAIGIVVGRLSWQSGQQYALERLGLVVRSRVATLRTWMDGLQVDMEAALLTGQVMDDVRQLLEEVEETPYGRLYPVMVAARLDYALSTYLETTPRLHTLLIVDRGGQVAVASEQAFWGRVLAKEPYVQEGMRRLYIRLSSRPPENAVVVAMPIRPKEVGLRQTARGSLGVLVGYADASSIYALLAERYGLGETGETYLVDGASYRALTPLRGGKVGMQVLTAGVVKAVQEQREIGGVFFNYQGERVIGVYRWLPELQAVLVAEQAWAEVMGAVFVGLAINVGIAVAFAFVAIVTALVVTRNLVDPIAQLIETATRIAAGDFQSVLDVSREDEIGALARAFDRMRGRLHDMIELLEQRVARRTADLERRTRQLEAAAAVSRQVASVRDFAELLEVAVEQISARFGFYHAGIFLVDDRREYAVLRAASSEGGRKMLAVGHRLRLGEGIVGYVAETGEGRVALDVGEDPHFFDNPYLPETRSEMGLPLRSHSGEVVGVLDVQSTEPSAFSQADIAILQTMADQIALAMDNARLLESVERSLQEVTRLLQSQTREGWRRLMQRRWWGYVYDGVEVRPWDEDEEVPAGGIALPIQVRGQKVGELRVVMAERVVEAAVMEVAQAVVTQTGEALESARTFYALQETLQEARTLYDASREIARAQSPQEVLDVIVRAVAGPGVDRCVLVTLDVDAQGEEMIVIAAGWEPGVGRSPVVGRRWRVDQIPLIQRRDREPMVFNDLATDPDLDEVSRYVFTKILGLRSALIVPLWAREELLGWLMVESIKEPYHFSEREIRLYTVLAGQAALVMRNLQLLEDANRRVEREQWLSRVGDLFFRSVDVEAILRLAVQEVGRLPGVAEVAVHVAVPHEGEDVDEGEGEGER